MKKDHVTLAIVICFALAAPLAHADPEMHHGQEGGQMAEKMFKEADTNGDGAISMDEFNAIQAGHFKRMDANGDGKITRDEMEAGHKKRMGKGTTHLDKRFDAADANHDGGLNREEAKAMPKLSMYFDEVDTNKDGKVTREEYFDAMPRFHRGKKMNPDGQQESI